MKTTRQINSALVAILLTFYVSCKGVRIFEPEKVSSISYETEFNDTAFIKMQLVLGSSAREELQIFENGFALYKGQAEYAEKSTSLSAQEISQLKQVFVQQGFLETRSEKIGEALFAAPHYEIYFSSGSQSNTVLAGLDRSPTNVQAIVSTLEFIFDRILHDGLQFTLGVEKNQIKSGEMIKLQLRIENKTNQNKKLLFHSNQLYDFIVRAEQDATAPILWQWAEDKAFSQTTQVGLIRAGETLTFEQFWYGTDRMGRPLRGTYWISAALPANPGGITLPVPLTIE